MSPSDSLSLAERLESGELVAWPECPFALPDFGSLAEDVSYDPQSGLLDQHRSAGAEHLAGRMRDFSRWVTGWLANQLPEYAGKWSRDRAAWHSHEEATRPCRHLERNDLLHIDASAERPTAGRRILRLFVNTNASEPRVWATSLDFSKLLQRVRRGQRIPPMSPRDWCQPLAGLQRLIQRDWSGRPAYDTFMLKMQQLLRLDEQFQENAPRRLHAFAPGSMWLLFTDGLAHAELRGQFALEHSWFVPPHALVRPDLAPLEQLVAAAERAQTRRAA